MKFYHSPFVMPVGIIVYMVVSMFTTDVEALDEAATDYAVITVQADLDGPAWLIPIEEAGPVIDHAGGYPYVQEVDYAVSDTVVIRPLPSI